MRKRKNYLHLVSPVLYQYFKIINDFMDIEDQNKMKKLNEFIVSCNNDIPQAIKSNMHRTFRVITKSLYGTTSYYMYIKDVNIKDGKVNFVIVSYSNIYSKKQGINFYIENQTVEDLYRLNMRRIDEDKFKTDLLNKFKELNDI